LNVYQKNKKAIRFYLREKFSIQSESVDDNTGEKRIDNGMEALNSSLSIYGSLSTGCRIRFSEDFHLHICHA